VSGELPSAVPVADTGTDLGPLALGENTAVPETPPGRFSGVLLEIMSGNIVLTILAIVASLVVGGILLAVTDPGVQTASAYFFGRPGDTFVAIWKAVSGAYVSIFQGGVFDYTAGSFGDGIASFFNSLNFATPLIAAGLGIAVGFRSGIFNIGGTGIILAAAASAGWVGFALNLPAGVHMIVAVIAGLVAGGIWGFVVGFLKARTGAHEVIVTIMLNYVALYLIDYLLNSPVLRDPSSNAPVSPAEKPTAVFFPLLGSQYALNFGFILVIVATIYCWWLLSRSSLGFKLRAVGENPRAARVAGIRINRMYVYVMIISGVLVGLAGVYQVLGKVTSGFERGIDANIGFTAITVALLGRSKPGGVFAAGILFGILQAGSYTMQANQNVNVNFISVIQAVIVLFLAAPPLVRAIFRLPTPGVRPKSRSASKANAAVTGPNVAANVPTGASTK
jgi:general nucleoside transport system permease protein